MGGEVQDGCGPPAAPCSDRRVRLSPLLLQLDSLLQREGGGSTWGGGGEGGGEGGMEGGGGQAEKGVHGKIPRLECPWPAVDHPPPPAPLHAAFPLVAT